MSAAANRVSKVGSSRASRVSWLGANYEPALLQIARKSTLWEKGESLPLSSSSSLGGLTTTYSTFTNLVTTMVGAGIVGFPATFALGGWVLSPILIIMCAWVVIEIGYVIDGALVMCEAKARSGCTYSFGLMPEKYEDMLEVPFGLFGKVLGCLSCNFFLLMVGGAFMILIGQSIEFLLNDKVAYRVCVLAISVVFIPLTMVNNMAWINRLSVLGVVASVLYVVAIASAGLTVDEPQGVKGKIRLFPENIGDLGRVVSVMLLGFTYQMVAPSLRSEMEEPAKFPKALNWAVALVGLVYCSAGATGFYGWGPDVDGNVLKSMKDKDGSLPQGYLLAGSVIVNLSVTFPITQKCACVAFERTFIGDGAFSIPLRLALFGISFIVGFFCPYFLEFLGIVSALLGVSVGILMPLASYWTLKLEKHDDTQGPLFYEGAKHFIIFIIAAITLICGTISGIEGMAKAISENGSYWETFWLTSTAQKMAAAGAETTCTTTVVPH